MKQKRKLFDELMEGVDVMQQQREGKITLGSHEVEDLPPLQVHCRARLLSRTGSGTNSRTTGCCRNSSAPGRSGGNSK